MPSSYSKKLDHKLFKLTALDGTNYETWSGRMMIALEEAGIKPVVLGIKTRPNLTPGMKEKNTTGQELVKQQSTIQDLDEWDHMDEFALQRIQLAVSDRELPQIRNCKHAKEAWDLLRKTHKVEGGAGEVTAIRRLRDLRMEEGEPVQEYIDKFQRIIADMSALGLNISNRMSSMFFLSGLPASLELFIQHQTFRAQESEQELNPTAVATSLLIHVRTPESLTPTGIASSKGTALLVDDKKTAKCHHCNKVGHFKSECWELNGGKPTGQGQGGRGRDFGKGRKENRRSWKDRDKAHRLDYGFQAGSDFATSTQALFAQTKHGYIASSAASNHIVGDRERFVTYKAHIGTVTTANGSIVQIIGIGSIHLQATVKGSRKTFTISDVYHIPGFSNLLSIGQLGNEGVETRFPCKRTAQTNKRCQFLRDGSLFMEGTEASKNLYMLDVSCYRE